MMNRSSDFLIAFRYVLSIIPIISICINFVYKPIKQHIINKPETNLPPQSKTKYFVPSGKAILSGDE